MRFERKIIINKYELEIQSVPPNTKKSSIINFELLGNWTTYAFQGGMFSDDKQLKCIITRELLSKHHCFGLFHPNIFTVEISTSLPLYGKEQP